MPKSSSAPVSVSSLRSHIERSGLLPSFLLDPVFAAMTRAAPADIVDHLVDERLLTPFQARLLMQGRHAEFFLTDKYKLLDFIGAGGMGKVYLCEQLLLHRLVSVKLLQVQGEPGDNDFISAVERFHREARAVAALDHPNIVRVFDVDRIDRCPFMVMEYVDGTNLHHLVTRHTVLSVERAAHCVAHAAAGLEHARQAGLVHRDIKPSNILLDRSGTVKLLDLGLARFAGDSEKNEQITDRFDKNLVIGTVDFMAPEQVVNSSLVDARSDIYSLGCTMYFLLTGRVPFPEKSIPQKMYAHQNLSPEPISGLCPALPRGLCDLLEKMMEKDPADRFQTPAEVVEALAPWTAAPVPPPPPEEMPALAPSYYRLGLSRREPSSSAHLVTPSPGSSIETRRDKNPRNWRDVELPSSDELLSLSGAEIPQQSSATQLKVGQPRRRYNRSVIALLMLGLLLTASGGIAWWMAALPDDSGIKNSARRKTPPGRASDQNKQSAPFAGTIVKAGGSTFINPVMQHWAGIYEKLKGVRIDYQDVGSGKGRKGVLDGVYQFGCSDAPLSDKQVTEFREKGGEVIHVPLVMGAVVPAYNLPTVRTQLRFTGKILGDIYLNKINFWDDPAIQANNPGVTLPPLRIVVMRRSDASGTTFIWTDYLAAVNAEWKSRVGVGTEVAWPVGGSAIGNQGMADLIGRNIGSIGYTELTIALENNLSFGLLKNSAGKFVKPSVESVTAAAAAKLQTFPDDLRYSLIDAPGADSYPISGTAWAILFNNQADNRAAPELVQFLRWATHEGQAYVKELNYAPLPPELVKIIDGKLDGIELMAK